MLWITSLTFVITLMLYAVAQKLFYTLGLLDFPKRYGLKRAPLPYPTGIVAVVVFLTIFGWISWPLDQKELGVIVAVLLLALVSFRDDRAPLPPALRLIVQISVAFLIFATGSRIYTITSPLGGILKLDELTVFAGPFGMLPVLGGIFTIAWLLLTINALNWFDGIAGQVSVISVIGFLMLGLLALLRNGEQEIALLAFILAGIALAGLVFEFPRPTMLLGDTGAMFFGLMLGLLSVYHGGKVATAFLALGIPLIDAMIVVFLRLAKGKSPLRGGRDHLHHKLLSCGWSSRQIVILTTMVGTLFGGSALFLSTTQKGLSALILFVMIATLHWASSPNRHHR